MQMYQSVFCTKEQRNCDSLSSLCRKQLSEMWLKKLKIMSENTDHRCDKVKTFLEKKQQLINLVVFGGIC